MPLNRRQLITTAVATAVATGTSSRWATAATPRRHRVAAAPGGHYSPNAAPLHPTAFLKLPPGKVKARGWLAGQLKLQLEGLCGRYEEFSHFLDFTATGWVRPDRGGWEEVPYWLRGYADLAIVTGDTAALATTRRWMDAILATGQSDGFFGPKALRTSLNGGPDFWPFLPLIQALRSWQEYSGDIRIIPFLSRFFRYMNAQGPGAFNTSWIALRWGDGLDSAMWLYNRTGDAFLLDLVDKIHRYGANWGDNLVNPHNVNIAQGFREPAQFALRSGSATDTRNTYGTYAKAMDAYGQFPGGGFAGDENARPGHGDPRQGFETCGIVEFMASHQLLTRITGDPLWADRCEELAFNSLPASLDPSGKAVHYITCANSVDLDDEPKRDRQFQNPFAMLAYLPGVDQYRCCPHNYGMGWPYFTEELWLATPDGRLAAAMYAPSESTAKVTDGTEVTFTEETGYPFTDTVTLSLTAPKQLRFPLVLRVPAWCAHPEIRVNGQRVTAPAGPAFTRIDRTWASGDQVTLRLPQRTAVRTWAENHHSVSVDHGPRPRRQPVHPRRNSAHDDRPGPPHPGVDGGRRARGRTAPAEPGALHRAGRGGHAHPDGRGAAADHVLPDGRAGRRTVARGPLVPDRQPALRPGARRRRDVHRQQRPRRPVRRHGDGRPPVAAGGQRRRLVPDPQPALRQGAGRRPDVHREQRARRAVRRQRHRRPLLAARPGRGRLVPRP